MLLLIIAVIGVDLVDTAWLCGKGNSVVSVYDGHICVNCFCCDRIYAVSLELVKDFRVIA